MRRFRRRTTRRPRRTLRIRSRISRIRRPRVYDGPIHQKCFAQSNITVNAGIFSNFIHWNTNAAVVGSTTLLDSPEFNVFAGLFREYRVMYMQVKYNLSSSYFPAQAAGNGSQMQVGAVLSGSLMNNLTATDAQLQRATDYKTFNTRNPVKRNYKVGKFYKSRAILWLSTTELLNVVSRMATNFRGVGQGFIDNSNIGSVSVCWYVKFRGQIL